MKAYKCDRCGKLYLDQPDPIPIEYRENRQIVRRMGFINGESNPVVPDLCNNCMKSFITWWNLEQENA